MSDVRAAKSALRATLRGRRAALDPAKRAAASAAVCAHLRASDAYRRASTLLVYRALPGEVDLTALIEDAHASGRSLALPRVVGAELVLHAWPVVHGWLADVPGGGSFGIREPDPAWPVLQPDRIALACVPGVAFDAHGGRLGRGGGYYDRLLGHASRPFAVGVCFAFQRVEAVPLEPHDRHVDAVVDEDGWTDPTRPFPLDARA